MPAMPRLLWLMPLCTLACDGPLDEHPAIVTAAAEVRAPVPSKELFVTDLSVVNDARLNEYKAKKWNTEAEGGFSFGRLVDNMAPSAKQSDRERSDFVMRWLRTWTADQSVNGQVLAARPAIRDVLITPWKLTSVGKLGNKTSDCTAARSTSEVLRRV